MYFATFITLLTFVSALPPLVVSQSTTRSSKRGLVYVSSKHSDTDDAQFTNSQTDLTWYYDYTATPVASMSHTSLEFVPMIWGAPSGDPSTDTTFLDSVTSQLSSGANLTHILTFNEPDGTQSTGGSAMDPDVAARTWMTQIAPLRSNHSLRVGLPAVTGSEAGFTWLSNFNRSCASLSSQGCVADFIPLHWYGNFEGLASHIGQVRATYPTLPIWITEYAYPDVSVADTQTFYNQSASYLDSLAYVDRYSYFGGFRTSESNVGKNVAMLDKKGKLTNIGSWYLGVGRKGYEPSGSGAAAVVLSRSGLWWSCFVGGAVGLSLLVI